MAPLDIVRSYPLIDELLEARRNLWPDQAVFAGYRNHTYRMLNFARQWIAPSPERDEKLAICAVFHDLAVWPDGNLDYLKPSADLAEAYLDQIGRSTWKSEMRLMIQWHHKITSYRGENGCWGVMEQKTHLRVQKHPSCISNSAYSPPQFRWPVRPAAPWPP
jgi:hypothetical protein